MRPPALSAVSRGILAALAAGAIGSLPVLLGLYVGDRVDSPYRAFVSLWTNAFVIGYLVGALGPGFARLATDVRGLAALLTPAELDAAVATLTDTDATRGIWTARILGLVYGLVPNLGVVEALLEGRDGALTYSWLLVLIPLLWATVFPALWRLLGVSLLVYRLGRNAVRVDLDGLHPLGVFAEMGLRHLLLIVLGLAFIPLQAILVGGLSPLDFVPALAVTLPIGVLRG